MNYVQHLNFCGTEAKEIPCIRGEGAPTTSTEGAVGCLYMNTLNGDIYKCTAANNNVYTWKISDGSDNAVTTTLVTEVYGSSDTTGTSRIDTLETQVNQLSSEKVGLDSMPSYVSAEAEEVADNVLSVRNGKSFVFGAVSDLHTVGTETGILHAGQGMDAINGITQLDLVAIFGDIILDRFNDTYKEGFKYVKKCFHNVFKAVPYIQMQGNHDELSTDTTEEAEQKYFAYIGANNIGTVTDFDNRFRNYGYRDFDSQRFRVIYLNSADVSAAEITGDCYITASQFQWFVNTALDFSGKEQPETWHFIVMCHHPLNWYVESMSNLLSILDAYKGNGSGSISVDNETISYNFTSTTKPKFVAHFHGHLHNFRTETMGTNGVVSITIPNACFDRNNEYGTSSSYTDEQHAKWGDVNVEGNQRQYNKTSNSANDTAFNVIVIDTENEEIHAFCYGAGIHRKVAFDGILTETEKDGTSSGGDTDTYTNQIPLSINADDTPYVGDNDEDGYRVGYRINSSGVEEEVDGMCCTGFIPCATNQIIRVKNITVSGSKTAYVITYDANKTFKNALSFTNVLEDDGTGVYVGSYDTTFAYIRLSVGVIDDTSIVTIDQPISGEGTTPDSGGDDSGTTVPDEPTGGYTDIIGDVEGTDFFKDKRLSTSTGEVKDGTGYVTTRLFDLTNATTPTIIRTSGVDFSQSQSAVVSYEADGTTAINKALVSGLVSNGNATLDANGNLTLNATTWGSANVRLRLCGYGSGENLIVTINEEIE